MKDYSTFTQTLGLEPHHQMHFSVISRKLIWQEGGSYFTAKMQLVHSTTPADWAVITRDVRCSLFTTGSFLI